MVGVVKQLEYNHKDPRERGREEKPGITCQGRKSVVEKGAGEEFHKKKKGCGDFIGGEGGSD